MVRYLTSDPVGLRGGLNTFWYAYQNPLKWSDPMGLDIWIEGRSGGEPLLHQSINIGDPQGVYTSYSYGVNGNWLQGEVYLDGQLGGEIELFKTTTLEEDAAFKEKLDGQLGSTSIYGWDILVGLGAKSNLIEPLEFQVTHQTGLGNRNLILFLRLVQHLLLRLQLHQLLTQVLQDDAFEIY